MALSEKEQKVLDSLMKKKDAPDPPPVNRSISASIDLSDDKQVERAIKLGFLSAAEADDDDDGDSGSDGDDDGKSDSKRSTRGKAADKKPTRQRGYFD